MIPNKIYKYYMHDIVNCKLYIQINNIIGKFCTRLHNIFIWSRYFVFKKSNLKKYFYKQSVPEKCSFIRFDVKNKTESFLMEGTN